MKTLHIDGGRKFILAKLNGFYNKMDITIKYIMSYMYKKNGIVEKK